MDFSIQVVLRFIICAIKQRMLGERLWSPRVGSPGFASPLLHLATSQVGFQLLLLFPESRLPYPPLLLCRDWGSGEAQREDDNFQPTQLWLDLQGLEFRETLQVSWSGNINLHSSLVSCHIPNRGSSSLISRTLSQTVGEDPHRRVRCLRKTR